MRILVLNPEIPFPPLTGGQTRTFHLLKSLSAEHELTLVAFCCDNTPVSPPFPLELVRVPYVLPELCRLMFEGTAHESAAAYAQLAHQDSEPWFVSYYDAPEMENALDGMKSRAFDLVLIEHSLMARFWRRLPPEVPRILDLHNVHTLMAWRRAQETAGSDLKEFERTRSFERSVASACQLCLCCSESEAQAARSFLNVERVKVIPNGVDTAMMTPRDDPATPGYVLFTGMMDYEPNVTAVCYFATEVWPLIRVAAPGVTFHIVGARPMAKVQALAGADVFVHGSVPDMRPYFREASVVVVPLLHGGGTRLKILDAAACGKPIVSTSLGAEGLNFVDGRDIVLADEAPLFAQVVLALLSDAARRAELSLRARRVAEEYDWSKIVEEFRGAVQEVVHPRV